MFKGYGKFKRNLLKVVSIDPGSRFAGFSVIELPDIDTSFSWRNINLLRAGVVELVHLKSPAAKLIKIGRIIRDIVAKESADYCVIESAFFGVNPKTALKLGEVRGAIISSLYELQVEIFEITPNYVKKNVTGNGHASKEQVKLSVETLLNISLTKQPFDVSDAIAIGLAFSLSVRAGSKNKLVVDKGVVPI